MTKIRPIQSFGHASGASYMANREVEVSDFDAEEFIRAGLAVEVKPEPEVEVDTDGDTKVKIKRKN